MKVFAVMLAVVALAGLASGQARYRREGGVVAVLLPDPKYTPGAVLRGEDPCQASFRTAGVRAVSTSLKAKVYAEYGVKEHQPECCEIDHLVSLELGGSNDIRNLWPQPYSPRPGAHEKDEVENWLHRQVCAGHIHLPEAQKEISTDWYKVYRQIPK